jgi:hypothetical protein
LVEEGALLEPKEGESMDRVAIRSLNSTPALDTQVTTAQAQRYLLAPRISQAGAETHGMFDLPAGKLDAGAHNRIVTHDGSLPEATVGEARYAKGVVPLTTPYLPDPLCRRLVVRFLDHDKAPITNMSIGPIPFYGGELWPAALPFRLLLLETGDAPSFDPEERILTIGLAKGEVFYLRLSWALDAGSLERMGLWAWRLEAGTPSTSERRQARRGGNWLLTPWRDVGLVHATQQPLVIPKFANFNPYRVLDHTYVEPRYRTPLSRKTTAKVDLFADWKEPIDDPENDLGPDNLSRSDHAYELVIPLEEPYDELNLFKTRERPRHELGDTKYRRITYHLDATSRFREYLPASLSADDLKRSSPAETIFVPNAARPEAPRVRYVIPTFGWELETSSSKTVRTRRGGSLRVYLERPWYSSGYGEMLAVVLPAAGGEPSADLLPYLTRWGRDPVWQAPPVPGIAPVRTAFPRARAVPAVDLSELQPNVPAEEEIVSDIPFPVSGLPLPEVEGSFVDIAPHDVGYDAERRLWYCDIEIDTPPSYFPFIRLALARYHPRSLYLAHLSPVVLVEFAQLHPDRALSVTAVPGNPRARRLTLSGPVHTRSSVANEYEFFGVFFGPPGSLGNVVEVAVERRQTGVNTDLGWEPAPDAGITEDVGPNVANVLWAGVVELPQGLSDDGPYRVVIREFEVFATEETDPGYARRPVYVDVVDL